MTTKRQIIADALETLGMAEYIFDATPEELQGALRRLNGLAAEWDGKTIRVGYNFGSDIDAESGLPDTAQDAFVLNLALRIAPSFGKIVSQDTKVAAKGAFNSLYVARGLRPETPYPSNLPVGRGSRRSPLEPQYFPDVTEVPGLNDGATEY